MKHLDKLKITNRIIRAAKPRRKLDAVEYRREKLIANLEEQIELANLAIAGEPLELNRKRGHQVKRVRPRIWWTTEADGKVFTQIRYNKIPLKFERRGNAIEVGKLRNLPRIYRTVVEAVEAGELDQALENAAKRSRPRMI